MWPKNHAASDTVRGSGPDAANVVVAVAAPPEPTAATEIRVKPARNATSPRGTVPSAALTVAVRVTVAPAAAGSGAAVSVVVVATGRALRVQKLPPLAVVRLRLSVRGPVTARAGAAVSAAAPRVTPISPPSTAIRASPVPGRHLSLASRRQPRSRTIPPTHRYGSHHRP